MAFLTPICRYETLSSPKALTLPQFLWNMAEKMARAARTLQPESPPETLLPKKITTWNSPTQERYNLKAHLKLSYPRTLHPETLLPKNVTTWNSPTQERHNLKLSYPRTSQPETLLPKNVITWKPTRNSPTQERHYLKLSYPRTL